MVSATLIIITTLATVVCGDSSNTNTAAQPSTRIVNGPGQGGIGQGNFGQGIFGGFRPGGFGHGIQNSGEVGFIPGFQAPPAHCRFWCRTPLGQAYCCETANQRPTPVFTKPGRCPPIRPNCPLRSFGGPNPCSNDGACGGIDKCCFDTCLQIHVCKPPHGFGR